MVDASNGSVLFEDGADRPGYPASMLKLMDLFLVFDQAEMGRLALTDMVQVTKEAAEIGGSQVYLDVRESFTVEDLLYALAIQSANDAAMALAIHVAGSRDGFVQMMNDKARELGLSPVTRFQSPHGLPPGAGQRPDMTTARDFAVLCRALLDEHPEVLKYTSATFRVFRQNPLFEMRTHNRLLGTVAGCDGLKTGYFKDAGYSVAATVQRNGARIVVVVLGSIDRKTRDDKVTELVARYMPMAARKIQAEPAPAAVQSAPVPEPAADVVADPEEGEEGAEAEHPEAKKSRGRTAGAVAIVAFAAVVVAMAVRRRLLLTR